MPYDAADLSPVTEKNIAKVRAKENLARLRDFIGSLPKDSFNMGMWGTGPMEITHTCRSVGCIGGWGEAFFEEDWDADEGIPTLGLTLRQAKALFYPDSIGWWSRIMPKHAVAALDNVIETGWPRWREAIKAK